MSTDTILTVYLATIADTGLYLWANTREEAYAWGAAECPGVPVIIAEVRATAPQLAHLAAHVHDGPHAMETRLDLGERAGHPAEDAGWEAGEKWAQSASKGARAKLRAWDVPTETTFADAPVPHDLVRDGAAAFPADDYLMYRYGFIRGAMEAIVE